MENVTIKEQNQPIRLVPAPDFYCTTFSLIHSKGDGYIMNERKQRWLERQREQEENVFLCYQVERSTYFSDYTAEVIVDHQGRTTINLYEGEPEIKAAWGLLTIRHDPVSVNKIGRLTSVGHTITSMIIDYEIPLYQQYMVEEMESHLDINYAQELGKKRQRMASADVEPAAEEVTVYVQPEINDFFESVPELTEDEIREQKLLEAARKSGKDPNSLRNLIQFKDKKAQ